MKEKPHYTVVGNVLNLPSQGGLRLEGSALAEAYRVTTVRLEPNKWVLAQNAEAKAHAQ